jgi:type IV secretion system protein TrbE
MLRLDKVIKPWKESAALNAHINLYGFWNETTFVTKSGDLGMVLSVPGVDYESLDRSQQEYAVKRLEAALKAFGPGFHVYQYLFKSNRPDIPFATYDDPIVAAASGTAGECQNAPEAYRIGALPSDSERPSPPSFAFFSGTAY